MYQHCLLVCQCGLWERFACTDSGSLCICAGCGNGSRVPTVVPCVFVQVCGNGSRVPTVVPCVFIPVCGNGSRGPTPSPCVFVPGSGRRSGNPVLPHPILVSGLWMLLVSLSVLLAASLNTSNGAVLLQLSYTFASQKDFIRKVFPLKKSVYVLFI